MQKRNVHVLVNPCEAAEGRRLGLCMYVRVGGSLGSHQTDCATLAAFVRVRD